MLRLRNQWRQRDQTAASTTEFVAQGAGERHRGFVGTVDERSGPTAGRRGFGGRGLPRTGKTASQESDTRANADTGRSCTAAIDPETCAELELRHTGTRSARQLGVSRVHTDRRRESAGFAKTLARLGQAIGPEVIGKLHRRLMELARERGVVQGRKMRVDATVVETNIHYPTDSSLLGDGARVLTRTMKKVEK